MNKRVENLLKKTKIKEIYEYRKDGIYINYGYFKGISLSKEYIKNEDSVERFLENILDSDAAPFKLKWQTREVLKDLKNNYPSYEKF